MSELTLLVLKLGFLALLWAFVFMIVYALRSDLFGRRARRLPTADAAPSPFPSPAATPPPVIAATAGTVPVPRATAASTATEQHPVPRGSAHAPSAPSAPGSPHLVITSGARAGLEVPLVDEQLTIGRSGESGLVIRDDYTSTHHARLLRWDDNWMLQDLDSTNGTFVGGVRVGSAPMLVPYDTEVKIGTTTFELRR